jgi:hypothetical protein
MIPVSVTTDTLIRTIEEGKALFEARHTELWHRAHAYFRDMTPEARDEAVANALFLTWQDFVSLIERALANDTLLSTTFAFACRRTRSGRTGGKTAYSGGKELFNHARRHSLDMDAFVADRTSVFDAVAFKVDTESWLESLPESHRTYAVEMAEGMDTKDIAARHHVTPPAVSMRRKDLKASYEKFMGA